MNSVHACGYLFLVVNEDDSNWRRVTYLSTFTQIVQILCPKIGDFTKVFREF